MKETGNVTRLGLSFGALAPKLRDQIKEQGLKYPNGRDFLQEHANKITSLLLSGILNESEAKSARKRLLKRLCSLIRPI